MIMELPASLNASFIIKSSKSRSLMFSLFFPVCHRSTNLLAICLLPVLDRNMNVAFLKIHEKLFHSHQI